jgi:hypothetical protein
MSIYGKVAFMMRIAVRVATKENLESEDLDRPLSPEKAMKSGRFLQRHCFQ